MKEQADQFLSYLDYWDIVPIFFLCSTALVGLGFLPDVSRVHLGKPHSVELLWASDRLRLLL